MNRLYVTGDLHQSIDICKLATHRFSLQKELDKSDVMIVCGDAGLVWDGSNEDKYWQKWLSEKNFTTFCCLGNHEGYHLINDYPIVEIFGGRLVKFSHLFFTPLAEKFIQSTERKCFLLMVLIVMIKSGAPKASLGGHRSRLIQQIFPMHFIALNSITFVLITLFLTLVVARFVNNWVLHLL